MPDSNSQETTNVSARSLPLSVDLEGGPRASTQDPLRHLLQRLEGATPLLAKYDIDLARQVSSLNRQGTDPDQLAQPLFRTAVAYALQDVEKTAIGNVKLTPALRAEMTTLASDAPGLENTRLLALLRQTTEITDKGLIREIRNAATEIGKEAIQTTPETQSRIDVIENRLRLTSRPPEPAPPTPPSAVEPSVETRKMSPGERPTTQEPIPATQRPETVASAVAVPGNGQHTQPVLVARSPLDAVFAAMRPSEKGSGAPWEPAPTPMRERLSAFEKTMQEGADDRTLQRAEKSGRAALEAMQAFSAGEGATVMNRIREAARSEPGGMAAVLSEMKQGGRFADLRGQFNNALFDERGVSAAYDRAASALARYGENRPGVEQIIARRPDAANLSGKFEQLDAAIGEAAGSTPSRKDGKAMIDDLAKTAAELLHRAVEAVKSILGRSPEPSARPNSPGPS